MVLYRGYVHGAQAVPGLSRHYYAPAIIHQCDQLQELLESIQANTIAYSEKLIDQMMDSIDDYIEDMKRMSSMPAYVNEIKQNLIRSNRYYEQKQMMEGKQDTARVAPGDLDLLLSIQRGIEENISFINNIKREPIRSIFLMPTGMVTILPRMGASGWICNRATGSGASR